MKNLLFIYLLMTSLTVFSNEVLLEEEGTGIHKKMICVNPDQLPRSTEDSFWNSKTIPLEERIETFINGNCNLDETIITPKGYGKSDPALICCIQK